MAGASRSVSAKRPGWERIGTTRFEAFLRNILNIKGAAAPDLAPQLQGGLDLTRAPWELCDLALAAGWRGFEAYHEQGAVVAEYGQHMVSNPGLSGLLVVVEHFYLADTGAAYASYFGLDSFLPETQVTSISRMDGRGPLPVAPAIGSGGQFWAGTAAAGVGIPTSGQSGLWRQTAGGVSVPVRGPWVVPPGLAFRIGNAATNTAQRVGVRWWERAAEPSESVLR